MTRGCVLLSGETIALNLNPASWSQDPKSPSQRPEPTPPPLPCQALDGVLLGLD
eukprot:CAMPEP_0198680572 /NCGR_PEP_ID=MMETSP1468-20131203/5128_1 /TAXON_ID=1461545 /ORGANISM="Mantoniella sp, Strain CCMP1436" /LENGTH=53 /DNA_ID=CAMNT_0044421061 /DNA_START=61 /DNA_END=219 /DNA_ORIENTATION=-